MLLYCNLNNHFSFLSSMDVHVVEALHIFISPNNADFSMFPQKRIPGSWALFSSAFSTTDPPPFCSTETKTGTGAPVEATQVWAEWEDEVVGPAKLFSYYMSQKDTCLPCYNMTKLDYYPPQCHFLQNWCLSYSCTSSFISWGATGPRCFTAAPL